MTRVELIDMLDGLAWSVRRYGHDDCGLDGFAVDENGVKVGDSAEFDGYYHPESVALADELIAAGCPVE